MPVQPRESRAVLGAKPFCEENRVRSSELLLVVTHLQARGVGDRLAEVVVVGGSHHVLHHDQRVPVFGAEEDVGVEPPDRDFRALQFEVHTQRIAQQPRVLGEPRREIGGLVGPDIAEANLREGADFGHRESSFRGSAAGARMVARGPFRLTARGLRGYRRSGPKWRNWQTRWSQKPLGHQARAGSSPAFGTNAHRGGRLHTAGWCNGSTQAFEASGRGSNPCPASPGSQ